MRVQSISPALLLNNISNKKNVALISLLAVLSIAYFAMTNAAVAASFDNVSFTKTDTPLSSYQQIHIAQVETKLPGEELRNRSNIRRGSRGFSNAQRYVSDKDQVQKANDLYEDLRSRLSRDFEIVDQAGPGVLTIETTITRLASSRPTFTDLSDSTSLRFESIYAGGAEAIFKLSENGETIATMEDSYIASLNDGFPRVGIWSDTDRVFSRWSRKLAKFISKN